MVSSRIRHGRAGGEPSGHWRIALAVAASSLIGAWAGASAASFAVAASATAVGEEHYRATHLQQRLLLLARLPRAGVTAAGAAVTGGLTLFLAGLAGRWQLARMRPWAGRLSLGWLPLCILAFLGPLQGSLHDMGTRRAAAGLVGAALVGSWGLHLWLTARRAFCKRLVAQRRWTRLGFAMFGLLLPLTLWASLVQWPTGDEPHYLLAVESILRDGDLDIRNNHTLDQYRYFHPGQITHAHALVGTDGRWLSKHSPGLPVVAAPFYALGGRWGVVLLMTTLTAWLTVSLYRVALQAGADDDRTTALGWWASFSIPLLAYANQMFPAVIVALAVSEGCRLWLEHRVTGTRAVAVLLGLGLVPWFHLGSAQLSVPLMAALCLRISRRTQKPIWPWAAPLLVPASLILFYYAHLGRILPPFGSYGEYRLAEAPLVLLRLLVDQEHGILIHAPFWAGAAWGLAKAARAKGWLVPSLLGLAHVLLVASYSWWYGGWAPPGRFLLPVLPMTLVPLALSCRRVTGREKCLGGWAFVVGLAMTAYPAWRYNAHDGSAAILDSVGALAEWDVYSLFPSGTPKGFLLAGVYLAGFLWASWSGRSVKPDRS
jgi:hypothetical protein